MRNIIHTNGQTVFIKAKKELQDKAISRWVVPTNEAYLYLDKHGRPFVQRPNEPMVFCTLKRSSIVGEGFHNHYVQK